jgi:hypothetical protein
MDFPVKYTILSPALPICVQIPANRGKKPGKTANRGKNTAYDFIFFIIYVIFEAGR